MSKAKHITDINSFDKQTSIYKILFQDKTTSLLKHVIDKLSVDRFEGVNYKLPSILISGKEGKQLIAKALSTSLCSRFEHIQGRHLSMGASCGSLFKNVEDETVYHIDAAEELTGSSISMLYKLLVYGSARVRTYRPGNYETVSADNKLFVFSTDDTKLLCPDLFKSIDYHCFLQSYSTEQREILVEQRLRWANIKFVEEIPAIIALNGKTMAECFRLLAICFLVMRGDGRTKMILEDVEKAIGLNSSQGLISPPVDSEIPF